MSFRVKQAAGRRVSGNVYHSRRRPSLVRAMASRETRNASGLAPDGRLGAVKNTDTLKGFVPTVPVVPQSQSFVVGAGGAVVIFLYMLWNMRKVKNREEREREEEETEADDSKDP